MILCGVFYGSEFLNQQRNVFMNNSVGIHDIYSIHRSKGMGPQPRGMHTGDASYEQIKMLFPPAEGGSLKNK